MEFEMKYMFLCTPKHALQCLGDLFMWGQYYPQKYINTEIMEDFTEKYGTIQGKETLLDSKLAGRFVMNDMLLMS